MIRSLIHYEVQMFDRVIRFVEIFRDFSEIRNRLKDEVEYDDTNYEEYLTLWDIATRIQLNNESFSSS